jgi:hypothetical protein
MAHAVCGSEVSPASSGARASVKFGLFDGESGAVVFACGSV